MKARDYLTRAFCGNLFKTFDFPENLKVIMQLTSSQVVFYIFLLNWEFVGG